MGFASEELVPGQVLGRYTLIQRVALGGMAEIWRAEDRLPDGRARLVALKLLLPTYAKDEGFRRMFADEVRIATQLDHENIVKVFEALEIGEHVAQAMELLDGKDLRRVLSALVKAGEVMPVPIALSIAISLARALGHAHTRKGEDGRALDIVHRDVSPHNVMITRDGRVKLLDFGIAHAAERLTRTRTGVIKGKVAYMAPEQAAALPVTPRTDIFALGIVLWEMLAMQRLFRGDSDAQVLERVLKAEVPPVREQNPEVPAEIEAYLGQMLGLRAALRPESARAVEATLLRMLQRHFREDQVSAPAIAAFVSRFLDPVRKEETAVLPEQPRRSVPTPLAAIPDERTQAAPPDDLISGSGEPSSPVESVERTLAMRVGDAVGASGSHPVVVVGAAQEPGEVAADAGGLDLRARIEAAQRRLLASKAPPASLAASEAPTTDFEPEPSTIPPAEVESTQPGMPRPELGDDTPRSDSGPSPTLPMEALSSRPSMPRAQVETVPVRERTHPISKGPTSEPIVERTPATPAGPSSDPTTDPVRLPTRSEIVRAVDNVPTMPVQIGASPEEPSVALPEVSSLKLEAPPAPGFAPPSPREEGSVPKPAAETLRELEVSEEHAAFQPMKIELAAVERERRAPVDPSTAPRPALRAPDVPPRPAEAASASGGDKPLRSGGSLSGRPLEGFVGRHFMVLTGLLLVIILVLAVALIRTC